MGAGTMAAAMATAGSATTKPLGPVSGSAGPIWSVAAPRVVGEVGGLQGGNRQRGGLTFTPFVAASSRSALSPYRSISI